VPSEASEAMANAVMNVVNAENARTASMVTDDGRAMVERR